MNITRQQPLLIFAILLGLAIVVGCATNSATPFGLRIHDDAICSDCGQCHENIEQTARPGWHDLRFVHRHKLYQGDPTCERCHGADACTTCHRLNKPASHTGGWKTIFHGKEAARDRRKCTVCHEGAYCQRCHQERPPSHGDNFRNRHAGVASGDQGACMFCHRPAFCAGCHPSRDFGEY